MTQKKSEKFLVNCFEKIKVAKAYNTRYSQAFLLTVKTIRSWFAGLLSCNDISTYAWLYLSMSTGFTGLP